LAPAPAVSSGIGTTIAGRWSPVFANLKRRWKVNEIVNYNITDMAIAKMEADYMDLVVAGFDDEDGFRAVHDARMVVKGHRVAVEKKRKELKADALAFGKLVDGEAKRITVMLEPIERRLTTEEEKVTKEKERLAAIDAEVERQRVQSRVDELAKYGKQYPFSGVQFMDDQMFADMLQKAKADFEVEQVRIQKEEADRLAEIQRLADQREEQSRIADEQRVAQEKIDAQLKAIEDAKKAEADRKDREDFEKKAKEDARIAAEKAAADKIVKDALEAKEAEDRKKAEAERAERMKPDKEKLISWIESIMSIPEPKITTDAGNGLQARIRLKLNQLLEFMLAEIKEI